MLAYTNSQETANTYAHVEGTETQKVQGGKAGLQ